MEDCKKYVLIQLIPAIIINVKIYMNSRKNPWTEFDETGHYVFVAHINPGL